MAMINDGNPTLIDFSTDAAMGLTLKEKSVVPPGWDGGGPNDTSTMRNSSMRTKQPKTLLTMTSMTAVCSYDPIVLSVANFALILQSNQLITVTFPDTSTLAFWGWLDKITPGDHAEGSQPTLTITVECSNQDNGGAEMVPVYTAP